MYCATKRYNMVLSNCMREAYNDQIDVMTVTPGPVLTALNPDPNRPFTCMKEPHAKAVVNHLGRYDQTWGWWQHAFMNWRDETGPISWITSPYTRRGVHNHFAARFAKE